jgi:hypothetical protein
MSQSDRGTLVKHGRAAGQRLVVAEGPACADQNRRARTASTTPMRRAEAYRSATSDARRKGVATPSQKVGLGGTNAHLRLDRSRQACIMGDQGVKNG